MISILNIIYLTIIILFLDFLWIYLNYNNYDKIVQKIQGSPIKLNMIAGIVCYIVLLISLIFYAIPMIEFQIKINKYEKWQACLIYGGGLGFIIYAVYNLTTLSILKNHNWQISILDMIWGTSLYTLVTLIYFYLLL